MPDLDGFLFDVEAWFSSTAAQRMSFMEKGLYLVMLFQQWREKSRNLPDDPQQVADLIAITSSQVEEVLAAWDVVRRKFITSKHDGGRIYNATLEEARRKQRAWRRDRAADGKRGAEIRWAKHKKGKAKRASGGYRVAIGSDSDLSRSDLSRSDLKEQTTEIAPPAPPFLVFPTVGKDPEWALSEAQIAEWARLYPHTDVKAETRKALAWVQASPGHCKTAGGMTKFLVSWLNRATDSGRGRVSSTGERPFSAQELAEAKRVRQCWLQCRHDPPCAAYQACLAAIIRKWRKDRGEAA